MRVFAGSTGTAALHMPQGGLAGTANGDFVSDNTPGALNTFYRYFIEVPAGATKLQVDLYDADVGNNAGEDVLGRDRDRGGYDTVATYRLFNPAGAAVTPRFTTGNTTTPTGADANWLLFYSATGNTVLDQFGTAAYTNNNGTDNWTGNWVETDGGGGGATGGAILVTGGSLRISDNVGGTPNVYREADLLGTPGLNMSMAFLTFNISTSGNLENTDQISVQISNNGGGSYTTLETFSNDITAARSYDITAFISNNTRVRFLVAGGLSGGEYFTFDNVQIADGPLTSGHWELQIDQTGSGDDINAIGIRAHDGDATSGGTEFNVYADSFLSLGVNPDGSGGNTRTYTLYPWVTSGCSCTQNDFDRDSDGGAVGSVTYTSRSGAFTQTFASGTLSVDDSWNRDNINNYTSDFFSYDYGIWTASSTINTYINTSGNYETWYVGNYLTPANPPAANPLTSGGFPAVSRIYLPTDAGVAPVKPYLAQYLTRVGGSGPAPSLGVPQTYTVSINVVNPTAFPITFSATNLVIANVPGGGTVYAGSPTMSQGSITAPAIGGTGNVSWNVGTLAAGSTALLAYNVTVTPAAATTPATGTVTSGNGTRATYLDETGNAAQARATYRLGAICQLNVVVGLATEVMLSSFDADRGHVSWDTASEAATIGFNLYREDGTKVNEHLIPAGQRHYEIEDATNGQRYLLEEVTSTGKILRHGPFSSMRRLGPDVPKRAEKPVRLKASADAVANIAADGEKAEAVMVGVRETGIVRVPFTELATRFGKNADNLARSAEKGDLSVKTGGQVVGYTSNADALLFFGEKSDSLYAAERIYRIEQSKGERMPNVAVAPSNASLSTFAGVVDAESDAFAGMVLPLDPESDYWFWDYLVSGDPTNGRKTFTVTTPDVAGTSGATLEVRLQGALKDASHVARVTLNGVPVGELSWSSLNAKTAKLAVPAGALRDGANDIEIEGVLTPADAFDVFYVDGFTVRYSRFARAVNGALEASITGNLAAGSFTTTPLVLDITKRLRPNVLTGGSFDGAKLAATLPAATKSVYAAERFIEPASYRSSFKSIGAKLRADYIVIAPAALRSGAEALASLRQREGLRTAIADLDQIYDDFSNGSPTPYAIRSFIASALQSSPRPRFIVLAGLGTFDYRGITQSPGVLPPLLIKTSSGIFASDSKLADANNDGVPDVAIGRIPVSTNAELLEYVDKLRDHSASAASNPIVFTADATDGETNFGRASDEAAQPVETRPTRRFHIDELGPQATRDGLFDAWSGGAPLVSWVGHGGLDQLGSSGFLTAGDAPALVGAGRLPVLVAMTCTINRFEVGFTDALGTALTRQPDGGALAVWSATGLSNHANARELQRTFVSLAAQKPALRVGELITLTLAAHPSDTAGIYVLLGDPAVSLELPKEMTNGGTPSPTRE